MVFKKAISNQARITKQIIFMHELPAFLRELMIFIVTTWFLIQKLKHFIVSPKNIGNLANV
jgi:hypothetical protein